VVNYVQDQSIMERDITDPSSVSLVLSLLSSLRLSFSVAFPIAFTRKEAKKMGDVSERYALSLVCTTWYKILGDVLSICLGVGLVCPAKPQRC
jgi:hypothetical protein